MGALARLPKLEYLSIDGGICNESINEEAFKYFTNLKTVEISDIQNVKEVVRLLLNNCKDIEKINLDYYDDFELLETYKYLENDLRERKNDIPLVIRADLICYRKDYNFAVLITRDIDSKSDSYGKNLYEKFEIRERNSIKNCFETHDVKCLIENIALFVGR